MGFFSCGSMLGNRAAKKTKKKIKGLEKAIAEVHKAIEIIGEGEKECLEEVARELEEEASKYEGRYESVHLERMERCVNHHETMRQCLLAQLPYVERLKQKHIEALQNGDFTAQKQRQGKCFSFF